MALSQSWPGVSGKAQVLDIRRDLAGAVVRQGVFASVADTLAAPTPLLNKTSTMTPTVREFNAAIRRGPVNDGSQLIYNDGPTGLFPTFGTAPQSGSRKDLFWVKAFDTTYDSKASVEFGITPGDVSAGTAVPRRDLMPTGALELGTLLLPAGATSLQSANVVWEDTFDFAMLRGGTLYVRRESLLANELTTVPLGTTAYAVAEDRTYVLSAQTNGTRYWLHLFGKPSSSLMVPASVFSNDGSRPVYVRRTGGRVFLEGAVRSSTAFFDSTISYGVGNLPVEFAPKVTKTYPTDVNRVHGYLIVGTNGVVSFQSTVSFTGVLDLTTDVANWADARTV